MLDNTQQTHAFADTSGDGGIASIIGFGPDRGRDIVLVVDQERFHVHSVIVRLFFDGKVFDTLVEQAYGDAQRQVYLCDDSCKLWRSVLNFIYEVSSDPTRSLDLTDALAAVPLIHKYEGSRMLPYLRSALSASTTEARSIRTPEVAEMLASHHMESLIQQWFDDDEWRTLENMSRFLAESSEDTVRMAALSSAQQILLESRFNQSEATAIIKQLSILLPTLGPGSQNAAIRLLGLASCKFARSPDLAATLTNGGFSQIVVTWFQDRSWLPVIDPYLTESCPENVVLSIIDKAKDLLGKQCRKSKTRMRWFVQFCSIVNLRDIKRPLRVSLMQSQQSSKVMR